MAFTLYTGQIIEALQGIGDADAPGLVAELHALTDKAATRLASTLGVKRGPLSELWDGNAAASFCPAYEGQELPEALAGCDSEDEWADADDPNCDYRAQALATAE